MSSPRINEAQWNLYLYEWGLYRKALMQDCGMSSKEATNYRHVVTTKALGYAKSSKKFTNAEFTKILAVLRARTQPTTATRFEKNLNA